MIFDPIMSLINGLRTKVGNATLTTTAQDLSGGVNELNDQIANVESDIAYRETGTTASHSYSVGQYLIYNDILYKAKTAISTGNTLTVGRNIESVSEGGLNALISVINFNASVTVTENATLRNIKASKCGRIAIVSFLVEILSTSTTWTSILNIPNEIEPYADYYSVVISDNNFSSAEARVVYGHVDIWRPVVGNTYLGTITYITNN